VTPVPSSIPIKKETSQIRKYKELIERLSDKKREPTDDFEDMYELKRVRSRSFNIESLSSKRLQESTHLQ
jgi:uncharacterized protein (UPF0335 family)